MELLFISGYQFLKKEDGYYAPPAFGDQFWVKYLTIFDSIKVLGVEIKSYLKQGKLSRISDSRIKIEIIPNNTHPKDFINDRYIKKILYDEIRQAEAIIIKPTLRKGLMAIKIAKILNKPYMIDITGDIHYTLLTNPSWLKKVYATIIYKEIVNTIKDAPFGIYVTEKYLQNKYPIKGKTAGITDSVIDCIDESVLHKRIEFIKSKQVTDKIQIGLIGSYNGNRKGIDIAIKALSIEKDARITLNVLYNGANADRLLWLKYARRFGLDNQLVFPEPKGSTIEVLQWIDSQDLIILPSRSEGLPRCIVEAMSRGCPCITSNVCGMPELINSRWIHKSEDYHNLSKLIKEMINSKELQIEVASENYNNSKRFLKSKLEKKRNVFFQEFKEYCQTLKK